MKQRNNTTMDPEHITWLRDFAKAKGGVSNAADLLGLSREALTNAIAGLPIHRGTAALLTQQITNHAKAKTS